MLAPVGLMGGRRIPRRTGVAGPSPSDQRSGESWRILEGHQEQIRAWLDDEGLTVVKIHTLLTRSRGGRPQAHLGALLRRAVRTSPWPEEDRPRRRRRTRSRAPGRLRSHGPHVRPRHGSAPGPARARSSRRVCRATASCGSPSPRRWPTSSSGFEAAWDFFGGIFAVVIPDNMAAIVDKANPTEPRLNAAFVEYAQDRGFLVDADAGAPSEGQAPGRAHGALRAGLVLRRRALHRPRRRPAPGRAVVHDARPGCACTARRRAGRPSTSPRSRLPSSLPCPLAPYDLPHYATPKVHRDHHVEVAKALYSVPGNLIGRHLDARADKDLVKLFSPGPAGQGPPPPGSRRALDRPGRPASRAPRSTRCATSTA